MLRICAETRVLSFLLRPLTVWHPQAEISSLQQLLLSKNAEIESLHTQLLARPSPSPESSERGKQSAPLRAPRPNPAAEPLALTELPSLIGDTVNDSLFFCIH